MGTSKIEWTQKVWNPVTGCTPVSEGCRNCYAKRMANRLKGRCGYDAIDPFKVALHPDRINQPLHWKKPSTIFVSSMGDLFHPDVPTAFLFDVFVTMVGNPQHAYIILTKRPDRMQAMLNGALYGMRRPFKNVVLGVSVENQQTADERIPLLLQTPAAKRIVSYEPALGPVDLDLTCKSNADGTSTCWRGSLDGVIMGGESGPGARPMDPAWARSMRDQCKAAGVPYFFKQWGEWWPHDQWQWLSEAEKHVSPDAPDADHYRVGKKAAGRLLDGKEHNELCWEG